MSSEGTTLVVIDDDSVDREWLRRLIDPAYKLHEAATGAEGIELVKSVEPDCVLVDYMLPDMVGTQLIPRISKLGAPVIMLTGEGDERVAVEAMKMGAFDYLTKTRTNEIQYNAAVTRALKHVELQRRLAEVSSELDQFVSGAAAGLRSPLLSLRDYLDRGLLQIQAKTLESDRSFLHLSAIIAEELCGLIDQLLNYSRVGAAESDAAPVDLNETLCNVGESLANEIKESAARISGEGLPTVMGAPDELELLFHHLIANSLVHRGDDAPEVMISASRRGEECLVTVSDNGPGIPVDQRENVFLPLKRLERSQSTPGSGIGLALCRRIVRRHGGRIWIASSPTGGAAITFTLPASTQRPPQPPTVETPVSAS